MKKLLPLLFILTAAACSKSGDKPNDVNPEKPTVTFTSSFGSFAGGVDQGTGFNYSVNNSENNIKYLDFFRDGLVQQLQRVEVPKTGNYVTYDVNTPYSGNPYKYHFEVTLTDNSKIVEASFRP